MADAFPGKQLQGRISPCIGNRHSPYSDHIIYVWVGEDSDNQIWLKRSILCKWKRNIVRRDAGFLCACMPVAQTASWVMMPVSPKRCPYLSKDASISKIMTEPDYIKLDSIEINVAILLQIWLLQMFFTKGGFQPKHPMWWHKVMSLVYCLVCDERSIHLFHINAFQSLSVAESVLAA